MHLAKIKFFALIFILALEANAVSFQSKAENDVLGKPISEEELKASENLTEDQKDISMDILEHSGHFEGDIVSSNEEESRNTIPSQKKTENDVLGKPISDEEIKASENLKEDEKVLSMDILEHSGHFEGDIVTSNEEESRNAIIDNNKKWPNAQIPYTIDASFGTQERSVIANSIRIFQTRTCIRFRAKTGADTDYVHIRKGADGICNSQVGRVGRKQILNLGKGCEYTEVVIHEFMHAVGFEHEHQRTDRDKYIRIQYENVIEKYKFAFNTYSTNQITDLNAPYDYCSIMHYRANAWTKNRKPTITVLKSTSCVIGQGKTLSEMDIKKLNTLYKCSGYPQVTGGCSDKDQRCQGWAARYCNDNQYKQWMTQNCAKSCKVCVGAIVTCKDKNTRCPGWAAKYCNNATYKQWMTQNCAKSCNTCSGGGGGRTCLADKQTARNCTYWKAKSYCIKEYAAYMKTNCDTTCNC